jgi:hypothetical protein
MKQKTHFSKKVWLLALYVICFYTSNTVAQNAVIIERNAPSMTNN